MVSKKTYIYGIFIVISASFTFQIYKFFEITFGEEILKVFFFGLFTIITIFIIIHGIKINPDMIQISFIMLSLLLSLILIIFLPILAEKTHILSYGLLSYLAIKDLAGTKLSTIKSILLALIFALFITSWMNCFKQFFLIELEQCMMLL